MPCLVGAIAFFFPRVALFLVFLFSDYLGRAFSTNFWPFMGFLFMPCTTLAYAGAMNENQRSVSGLWLVVFILAILIDLGFFSAQSYSGRRGLRGRFVRVDAGDGPGAGRKRVRNDAE
ncbi:MAG: hypothetical protein JNJ48_00220 [Phycisphaerae bacterium]|nr:hypothetical protein [Phycisphaerae bacterium]